MITCRFYLFSRLDIFKNSVSGSLLSSFNLMAIIKWFLELEEGPWRFKSWLVIPFSPSNSLSSISLGMYVGGLFKFKVTISSNYPHEPPKVKCTQKVSLQFVAKRSLAEDVSESLSKDDLSLILTSFPLLILDSWLFSPRISFFLSSSSNRETNSQIYHPNLDLDGNVCLNILRESWKPVLNLNAVMTGMMFLFISELNPEDPLNKGKWNEKIGRRFVSVETRKERTPLESLERSTDDSSSFCYHFSASCSHIIILQRQQKIFEEIEQSSLQTSSVRCKVDTWVSTNLALPRCRSLYGSFFHCFSSTFLDRSTDAPLLFSADPFFRRGCHLR